MEREEKGEIKVNSLVFSKNTVESKVGAEKCIQSPILSLSVGLENTDSVGGIFQHAGCIGAVNLP